MTARGRETQRLAAGLLLCQRDSFIRNFVNNYVQSGRFTAKYVVGNHEANSDEVRKVFGKLIAGKQPRNIDQVWLELESLDEVRHCRRLYSADCTLPADLLWDALRKIADILNRRDSRTERSRSGGANVRGTVSVASTNGGANGARREQTRRLRSSLASASTTQDDAIANTEKGSRRRRSAAAATSTKRPQRATQKRPATRRSTELSRTDGGQFGSITPVGL